MNVQESGSFQEKLKEQEQQRIDEEKKRQREEVDRIINPPKKSVTGIDVLIGIFAIFIIIFEFPIGIFYMGDDGFRPFHSIGCFLLFMFTTVFYMLLWAGTFQLL